MLSGSALLETRRAADVFESEPIATATWDWLRTAIQFRDFKNRRGQKHFSGLYWSATMAAHVGYESRLELGVALLADFDPEICFILSQPFRLTISKGGGVARHIPDYLLRYDDGRVCVVDVKPRVRLAEPRVKAQFAWTRRVIETRGWEYRVESESDAVTLENLRYLAGYRRGFQFDDELIAQAREAIQSSMSFGQAVREVARTCDEPAARAVVLHLLWTQHLATDMTIPLESTSILEVVTRA